MSDDLAAQLKAGDRRALARAITLIEDGGEDGRRLLESLHPAIGRAVRVGVTGPPGVGKSTTIDAIAQAWLARPRHVSILAVDPSSPFTGGALLGDRVRMNRSGDEGRVFIRSMATRGVPGGLARATADAADLLDASGADYVLIETVGAGQAEVDIARCTDVVLLLLSPESGDSIQAMKSGLMEIADLIVINKSDRPGADGLEAEIRQALSLSTRNRGSVPILRTQAFRGDGIPKVIETLEQTIEAHRSSGEFETRRRRNLRDRIRAAAEFLLRSRLWNGSTDEKLASLTDRVQAGGMSAYAAADALVRQVLGDRP